MRRILRHQMARLASLALAVAAVLGPARLEASVDDDGPQALSFLHESPLSEVGNPSSANSWSPAPAPTLLTWRSSDTVDLHSFASDGYASDDLRASCDVCPNRGIVAFVSYDSWRGIQDSSWQNNGIVTGANYGTRLGRFSDWTNIGFQVGGSIGVFDWSGTDYRMFHQNDSEPQGYFTYGLFRKQNETSNWSMAVVQDWMVNAHFGVFGQSPTLSQLRGQLGYATSARNEFGVWGAWRVISANRDIPGVGLTSWRPVNQLSAYWHYKFAPGGADTLVWLGVPEHQRLDGNGSLGDYFVGALATAPLNDAVSLYSLVSYMHASAAPGPAAADENAWNFTIGLALYPARNARSTTVAGQCWMPQLPVANNGYFLVDTNRTF